MSSDSPQPAISGKLNPVQLHLLELFAREMDEQELLEIKALLVQYYSRKVDAETDDIWTKKGFTTESFAKKVNNLHLRKKKQKP